ncbi:hypothetical protein CJ030_MR8G022846 [Morella rubra]|uniref:Uncharacterized protein n=1 Tax=Morella rubra TaxID=262757 RepID=A0A6A1US56_9ROSI|nr:hypothetical protein CJ030_MR8G022846 [Morella rubra]
MSKRARTSSQADIEQPSSSTLMLEQHTTFVMVRAGFGSVPNLPMSEEGWPTKVEAVKTDATTSLPHGILLTQFLHSLLEQPEEVGEQQDPGQSSTQGFGAQRPGWMDDMMTQLTERMQSVLRPTHEMVSDISCRLTTLEQKVMDMDSEWKKVIDAVQEATRKAATSAELFTLTQQVVHMEEHLSQIRDVLKITDDDDDDL